MKIKLSIHICKPISQVWGVFIDNNSWGNWYGGEIKSVNPQWQNGASIDWAKGEPSKITGFDSHKSVSFKGHNGTITNYFFNENDNNTTEFSIENDYTMSSITVINKEQVESQIETDLVSFRDFVELMDNVTLNIVTSNSNGNEVSPANNDFFTKAEIVKDEERLFITANDVYLHSVGVGDLFITITAIYFIHYPEKDKADRETSRICDWGFNLMERVNRHKGSLVFWQADLKSKHSDESGFYITKNHLADNLRYGASLKDIEIGQRDYKFTAIKTSQLRLIQKYVKGEHYFQKDEYNKAGTGSKVIAPAGFIDLVLNDKIDTISTETLKSISVNKPFMEILWKILQIRKDLSDKQRDQFILTISEKHPELFKTEALKYTRSYNLLYAIVFSILIFGIPAVLLILFVPSEGFVGLFKIFGYFLAFIAVAILAIGPGMLLKKNVLRKKLLQIS